LDQALLYRIDDIVTRGTMINPAEQLPESSAGQVTEERIAGRSRE